MKYFLDQEFIEGWKKPIPWLPTIGTFNKPYHSIQLISIGLKCEDGRELYLISNEFNIDDADEWVTENVLKPIYYDLKTQDYNINKHRLHGYVGFNDDFSKRSLKAILKVYGKSNQVIRNLVEEFVIRFHSSDNSDRVILDSFGNPLEFYGYYADYDWVLFCSLFGKMIDLPNGWPMYCKDLKQLLDEHFEFDEQTLDLITETGINGTRPTLEQLKFVLSDGEQLTKSIGYPLQIDEHNALADANWNHRLYQFLSDK